MIEWADVVFLLSCSILLFFYCRTIKAWNNTKDSTESTINKPRLTVLIPFRNEEKNILTLLHSLKSQNYPANLTSIILVDDHSTDLTVSKINEFVSSHFDYPITVIKNKGQGKKEALKTGLEQAATDWILCTDADCYFNNDWINQMVQSSENKLFVAGPVVFTGSKLIQTLSTIEMNIIQLFTLAGFYRKKPFICNAANMFFKKDDYLNFLSSKFNSNNASGDDVFFLHYLNKTYPNHLVFRKNKKAIVYTPAEKEITSLLRQKTRWASKTRNYVDKTILFEGSLFFFVHLCYFMAIFHLIFCQNFSILALITMLTKITGDIILIQISGKWFDNKTTFYKSLLFQLLFPIYSIVVFILALQGSYSWKDRNYSFS